MKKRELGKGHKPKMANDPVTDLGISSQERHDHHAKLRGETDEKTQRPVVTNKSIKSDRGTFKSKC